MIVQIDLPDSVVDTIVKKASRVKSITQDREIVITGDNRHALEAVFQTTIADGTDLVKKVRALSVISIGGIEHIFAPDEIARLDMQAVFHGQSRQTFIANMVKEIAGRMLEQT